MKLIKKSLCFFLSFLLSHSATAKMALYPAPQSSVPTYKAYLNLHSEYTEPLSLEKSEGLLLQDLEKKFAQAQTNYLQSERLLAETSFLKVIEMRHLEDWNAGARALIFNSLLRMAQIAPEKQQRDFYLKEAVRFDPTFGIDMDLFPPPLVEDFKNIKKEEREMALEWDLSKFQSDFSVVKVNGRELKLDRVQKTFLPQGSHRVTWLSNIYETQTWKAEAEELVGFQPPKIARVTGSCGNPDYKKEGAIFYSEKCIVKNEKGSAVPAPAYDYAPPSVFPEAKSTTSTSSKGSKKWIWIALGVVAAGFAVHELTKKNSSDSRPSHEEVY